MAVCIVHAYTGKFKKKETLSHVYNEVTSEPTITRYASIVRKALKALICYLSNTQFGNPMSHGTRQSDSPFLSRLSPACPCLWLPQRRWRAVSILEGVVFLAGGSIPKRVWNSRCTVHFATRSPLAAAARHTFPRQLQTNFDSFPNNLCITCDCRPTGYFIINMWKCYLLFELPCILPSYK
jgi:hypothetical protein